MKPLIKSICISALAALAILPLWVIAFPGCTIADGIALCLSVPLAVNGYLWATEEGK